MNKPKTFEEWKDGVKNLGRSMPSIEQLGSRCYHVITSDMDERERRGLYRLSDAAVTMTNGMSVNVTVKAKGECSQRDVFAESAGF